MNWSQSFIDDATSMAASIFAPNENDSCMQEEVTQLKNYKASLITAKTK